VHGITGKYMKGLIEVNSIFEYYCMPKRAYWSDIINFTFEIFNMDANVSEEKFDNKLLKEYNSKFYGYGKWDSDFWFIGIEEDGHNVQARLSSWSKLGEGDLIDIAEHHSNIEIENLFNPPIVLQSTWRKLILTLLSYRGKDSITIEERKYFQEKNWGRLDSNNLLIELFPLPSPSIKDSIIDKNKTNIKFLEDRETYYGKSFIQDRIKYIREKIILFKPKVILFYSNLLMDYWRQIIGDINLEKTNIEIKDKTLIGISYAFSETTCYIICPQPSWRNVNASEFWVSLGKKIKELRRSPHS
jgi:hypothetical protein